MPPPTMAPRIGPMNGSGMATTAPMAAAIAVRLASGFSSICCTPYGVYYSINTLGHQGAVGSNGAAAGRNDIGAPDARAKAQGVRHARRATMRILAPLLLASVIAAPLAAAPLSKVIANAVADPAR